MDRFRTNKVSDVHMERVWAQNQKYFVDFFSLKNRLQRTKIVDYLGIEASSVFSMISIHFSPVYDEHSWTEF